MTLISQLAEAISPPDVAHHLQKAIKSEFYAWDLYTTYEMELDKSDSLYAEISKELDEHALQESEHIGILSLHLDNFHVTFPTERTHIELPKNITNNSLLALLRESESKAIKLYELFLDDIDYFQVNTESLKRDLKYVLKQEYKHRKDLSELIEKEDKR
jgi:ferritin-like protein